MTVAPRLLIADDEEAIREVLSTVFSDAGYEVDRASDGREALELFRAKRHRVVVTDLIMPGLDGIELAREVRKLEPDAIVVVLTGSGPAAKERAAPLPCIVCVDKPVALSTLLQLVQRLDGGRAPSAGDSEE